MKEWFDIWGNECGGMEWMRWKKEERKSEWMNDQENMKLKGWKMEWRGMMEFEG